MSNDYLDELDVIDNTLTNGGIILYPTDTIWGIGCDAFNLKAIENIYKIKRRPRELPFILLVSSIAMLKRYVNIHPRLETLLVYHKKPLTLIYTEVDGLPEGILSEEGTIGIRVTLDPFCRDIIHKLDGPLVSTSANISGDPFPKSFHDISADIIRNMDYIVNHRQKDTEEGLPSVLAEFNKKGDLFFIRE